MAEVITNPFNQIFKKSVECTGNLCDLAPSKQQATQWIRSFASAMQATSPLNGMEIIANTGPESMKGECMIHCDLEKPSIKCRILTSPDPTQCTSAILTVVDRGDPNPNPKGWDGEMMSFRDEFSNVREFMNRFEPCRVNDGVNKDSIQNSFVAKTKRGRQAVNVGVGFTDNQGTRYGFCHIKSDSLSGSNLTLPDMRQPSGLGTLMMATPNPRFGGSLTERQCQDLLKSHYQMCINKFSDRDEQEGDGVPGLGYDTSQCDGLPERCRDCETRSACILKKKRDACIGITNWDEPEPPTLLRNETTRYGVPDADKFCTMAGRGDLQRAAAIPGFSPREQVQAGDLQVEQFQTLYTQLPENTGIGRDMPDERIQLRLNNCLKKCDGTCPTSSEAACMDICESLVLNFTEPDDSFDTYNFKGLVCPDTTTTTSTTT
jgi:hypothetical protein